MLSDGEQGKCEIQSQAAPKTQRGVVVRVMWGLRYSVSNGKLNEAWWFLVVHYWVYLVALVLTHPRIQKLSGLCRNLPGTGGSHMRVGENSILKNSCCMNLTQ